MQELNTIIEKIGELLYSPNIENDPLGDIKFLALYKEYLYAIGYEIKDTYCKCCGQKVGQPEDDIRLEYKDNTLHVYYTCHLCNIENELNAVSKSLPTDTPEYN